MVGDKLLRLWARGSEEDEKKNEDYVLGVLKWLRGEAVVAEGGFRKRQNFDISSEGEEQEIQLVTGERRS